MATLRDLRKRAKEMGIEYTKDDGKAELEEMIAAKECDVEVEAEAAAAVESAKESTTVAPEETPVEPKAPGIEKAVKEPSFQDDLEISESNLSQEFIEQPGKYAYYAGKAATANSKMLTARMRMDVVEAELYKKIRDEFVEAGGKPTEKAINSEMLTREEWKAAQKGYIKAQELYKIAKAAMDAFEHRRDMLIQLGSSARQERNQIGMNLHEKAKEKLGKAA